jgi:hypothetical protein
VVWLIVGHVPTVLLEALTNGFFVLTNVLNQKPVDIILLVEHLIDFLTHIMTSPNNYLEQKDAVSVVRVNLAKEL